MRQAKAVTGKGICLFGGGSLVTQFVELDLLDELSLSIIPVLLADGVPFFGRLHQWKRLKLVECKQFPSGIVILDYRLST